GRTACIDITGDPRGRLLLVFFFQAEDGIRVRTVTGVQTCALPISGRASISRDRLLARGSGKLILAAIPFHIDRKTFANRMRPARSEERRVGKECRSWW